MSNVNNELVIELLRKIHARIDRIDTGVSEVKAEINALRGNVVSIHQDLQNVYSILGRHDDRLDRIERRLELRELAEPQRPFNV